MKMKLVDNRLFTTFLRNDGGEQQLVIIHKDKARQPAVLGPQDFIPGFEPKPGITAADFLRAQINEKISLKPAVKTAVEKFIFKKPVESDEAAEALEAEKKEKVELAALNLFELSAVMDLIMQSDAMTGRDGSVQDFENLRNSFSQLLPLIIKNSRSIYDNVNDQDQRGSRCMNLQVPVKVTTLRAEMGVGNTYMTAVLRATGYH